MCMEKPGDVIEDAFIVAAGGAVFAIRPSDVVVEEAVLVVGQHVVDDLLQCWPHHLCLAVPAYKPIHQEQWL